MGGVVAEHVCLGTVADDALGTAAETEVLGFGVVGERDLAAWEVAGEKVPVVPVDALPEELAGLVLGEAEVDEALDGGCTALGAEIVGVASAVDAGIGADACEGEDVDYGLCIVEVHAWGAVVDEIWVDDQGSVE